MWKLEYSSEAEKFILLLDKRDNTRIKNAVESLVDNPDLGKQLVGPLKGLRSLRVGKYRVIYKKEKEKFIIFVVAIGLRKNIYK
jgi:mRNA interferase RelE/StbE